MKYSVLFWIGIFAVGCGTDSSASNGGKLTKSEYQAQAKADGIGPDEVCIQLYGYECDLCEELGWYGDGICDEFCTLPDTDCGVDPDAGPQYDPCNGLSCGDLCSLCDPADPNCIETAVVKYCDEFGTCQGAGIPYCDDGIGPIDGGTPYEPCANKSCGDECSLCDPADPDCVETAVVKACDASGHCSGAIPQCTPPKEYDPCEGLSCGDFCSLCDPADPNCAETPTLKFCDASGVCGATAAEPDCGGAYEPCAGKSCGDECSLCDPADPDCVETAVIKACDATGHCSAAIPQCTQP